MNEELMQMAREAGFELDCCSLEWVARIERFAQLVAAKEREACAKVCDDIWERHGIDCAKAIRARR